MTLLARQATHFVRLAGRCVGQASAKVLVRQFRVIGQHLFGGHALRQPAQYVAHADAQVAHARASATALRIQGDKGAGVFMTAWWHSGTDRTICAWRLQRTAEGLVQEGFFEFVEGDDFAHGHIGKTRRLLCHHVDLVNQFLLDLDRWQWNNDR